ncbi:hypothetical protein [Nocardioides xinjiangensis]|nr:MULTISPECIES: hypothetical protein [unclassified Nocardioides]
MTPTCLHGAPDDDVGDRGRHVVGPNITSDQENRSTTSPSRAAEV